MVSTNTLLKKLLHVKGMIVDSCKMWKDSRDISHLLIAVHATKHEAQRCPVCGRKCPSYDAATQRRTWRSLDLEGYIVHLVADTYRICCPIHGVLVARVPWAFHNSGFTKHFDFCVAWLACRLSRSAVSELLRVDWKTVGRCIDRTRHCLEPDSSRRLDGLVHIGIDETSYRKGHKYLTVVVNHDTNEVVWVKEKHGKAVFEEFLRTLTDKQWASIRVITGDGARWIDAGIAEYLPHCVRCVDSFHVVEWAMNALDEVRKASWREAQQKVREVQSTGTSKRGRAAAKDPHMQAVRQAQEQASAIKGSSYVCAGKDTGRPDGDATGNAGYDSQNGS